MGNDNPWFGLQYLRDPGQRRYYLDSALEHVELTGICVGIGILLAFFIVLACRRSPYASNFVIGLSDAMYSVPSIALFAILLPLTGLSLVGPIIGLTLYTQLFLVRGFLDGFRSVPSGAVDAARGLGYGNFRRLFKVELPMALPVLISAVRMATASTIGLIPVAFALSHGGLGQVMTLGYSNNLYKQQVTDAVIGIVLLAIIFDLAIVGAGKALMPWSRRTTGAMR